ncbi:uncharacterized protein N7482_003851 [Penicillium canariense]|uniref:Ankyrin n=1 Tax=Penicillium canariense TaxID=189055 RepID=A0A9W9IB65_9EURO|nr:uncharacterized protein N7482_003851 [Penicillium canariense]KAJ5168257.1 hypothetical protein N7482_003851 [Penicillium canariense]
MDVPSTVVESAIRAQSVEKVDLLLKLEANPGGYLISSFEAWQALFLRSRTEIDLNNLEGDYARSDILAGIPTPQTVHITELEVETRLLVEFWAGATAAQGLCDEYPNFGHSLVIAAGSGLVAMMDRLLATDADRSFWIAFPALGDIPEPPTPSSLALSSPIHEAISGANQSIEMLRHLLKAGFNPNVPPLGDHPHSIPPHPHITRGDSTFTTGSKTGRRVERDIPLEFAGATAMGHTLLHIACMSSMIQNHASKTRESIHNLRGKPKEASSIEVCELEFPAQMELLEYLLSSGFEQCVAAQDTDLNTPLHYLAGARVINENAIILLREQSDGETAWREVQNWYRYTAEEIWEQNHRVRMRKDKWFGGTTHKVAKMPTLPHFKACMVGLTNPQ